MNFAVAMSLGIGVGTALGVAFDELAMGVGLGASLGTVAGILVERNRRND